VGDGDARLWPFTSRRRSFDSLTLPVNLVVEGSPGRVRSLLTEGPREWNDSTREWQGIGGDEDGPVGLRWSAATGADRYTYVDTPGPGGTWIDETTQLHDGTYFGSRLHLRLYGSPDRVVHDDRRPHVRPGVAGPLTGSAGGRSVLPAASTTHGELARTVRGRRIATVHSGTRRSPDSSHSDTPGYGATPTGRDVGAGDRSASGSADRPSTPATRLPVATPRPRSPDQIL
jgi:hypothetical protein